MSADQPMQTLQKLLTHYARNSGPRRVRTKFERSELLGLVGARPSGNVVKYPHQWLDGSEYRTTTFELVPR